MAFLQLARSERSVPVEFDEVLSIPAANATLTSLGKLTDKRLHAFMFCEFKTLPVLVGLLIDSLKSWPDIIRLEVSTQKNRLGMEICIF